MNKILFVCAGNVARSQMAEAFYNHFSNTSNAISAGVLDFTPQKYVHPIPEVVQVMREEGIDVAQKKVKFVTKDMVNMVDKIYVLCSEKVLPEFVSQHPKVKHWNIKDPFDTDIESFRLTRDQIKKRVTKIL